MDPSRPFQERLWAFCIFLRECSLQHPFCIIVLASEQKTKCKGLTFSNELIQRDESLHAKFGVEMLNMLPPMDEQIVHAILKEAVDVEIAFVKQALPQNLTGLNTEHMCEYVQYCAERLLSMLKGNYGQIWNAKQRLGFMEMISIDAKTNFFERRGIRISTCYSW